MKTAHLAACRKLDVIDKSMVFKFSTWVLDPLKTMLLSHLLQFTFEVIDFLTSHQIYLERLHRQYMLYQKMCLGLWNITSDKYIAD